MPDVEGQPTQVAKWGQWESLADGTCHCGQPLKYNLSAGYVGHADPAVNGACPEPWPDAPNPAMYEMSRRITDVVMRHEVSDRTVGIDG